MNNISLVGRLTKDPEGKSLNNGTPVATFSIAVNRDYKDKEGNIGVDFIPIELLGSIADFATKYLKKGRLVSVTGTLRIELYEKDGSKKSYTKVRAKTITALDKMSEACKNQSSQEVLFSSDDVPYDEELPF